MRLLWLIPGAYLLLALLTRGAEALGLTRCHCADECWCKRPLLSGFRWVMPFWHR